jgi:hypothetical protein
MPENRGFNYDQTSISPRFKRFRIKGTGPERLKLEAGSETQRCQK